MSPSDINISGVIRLETRPAAFLSKISGIDIMPTLAHP